MKKDRKQNAISGIEPALTFGAVQSDNFMIKGMKGFLRSRQNNTVLRIFEELK